MANCPKCKTPINLADVVQYDKEPSTQKYYECPNCHASLIVYLKIEKIEADEEEPAVFPGILGFVDEEKRK